MVILLMPELESTLIIYLRNFTQNIIEFRSDEKWLCLLSKGAVKLESLEFHSCGIQHNFCPVGCRAGSKLVVRVGNIAKVEGGSVWGWV